MGETSCFLHPVWTALVSFLDKRSDRKREYKKHKIKAACSRHASTTAKKIQEFLGFAKLFHLFMGFRWHFLFSQSWTSQHGGNMLVLYYTVPLCACFAGIYRFLSGTAIRVAEKSCQRWKPSLCFILECSVLMSCSVSCAANLMAFFVTDHEK